MLAPVLWLQSWPTFVRKLASSGDLMSEAANGHERRKCEHDPL